MKAKKNKIKKSKAKIRNGDTVMAIRGNDKGQTGKVLSKDAEKVIVQGLNMRKKHVKRSEANPNGGVVDLERPIHISNLRVCINDDQPVKLRVRKDKDDNKELYYIDGGKEVKYRDL